MSKSKLHIQIEIKMSRSSLHNQTRSSQRAISTASEANCKVIPIVRDHLFISDDSCFVLRFFHYCFWKASSSWKPASNNTKTAC